jgi:hypothetical protein
LRLDAEISSKLVFGLREGKAEQAILAELK